jgi:hypothetical protein
MKKTIAIGLFAVATVLTSCCGTDGKCVDKTADTTKVQSSVVLPAKTDSVTPASATITPATGTTGKTTVITK